MGILDIVLGRGADGRASKINLALIALMLWRMYQGAKAGGKPAPSPRGEARLPQPVPAPGGASAQRPDSEFGELLDAMTRGNATRPHSPGGGQGGGGLGPLGDILGDILGGGRAGRGAPGGGQGGGQGGGLGPLGDILGDLLGGGRSRAAPATTGNPLADMLGGLLAGGGLGALLQQFEQAGRGRAAQSWVARGENLPLSPQDIEATFGAEIIDTIAEKFAIPKAELLQGLSEAMPQTVDRLTPEGHLPSREDIARWI